MLQKMQALIVWGQAQQFETILLEGILKKSVYGPMLADLKHHWQSQMITCYFELPFETTFNRNQTKSGAFDRATLASWWQADDLLGYEDLCFDQTASLETQVNQITIALTKA